MARTSFPPNASCRIGGGAHKVSIAPEWRNWQTRQVEGLVAVKAVQVQVLSPAVCGIRTCVVEAQVLFLFASTRLGTNWGRFDRDPPFRCIFNRSGRGVGTPPGNRTTATSSTTGCAASKHISLLLSLSQDGSSGGKAVLAQTQPLDLERNKPWMDQVVRLVPHRIRRTN